MSIWLARMVTRMLYVYYCIYCVCEHHQILLFFHRCVSFRVSLIFNRIFFLSRSFSASMFNRKYNEHRINTQTKLGCYCIHRLFMYQYVFFLLLLLLSRLVIFSIVMNYREGRASRWRENERHEIDTREQIKCIVANTKQIMKNIAMEKKFLSIGFRALIII